MSAKKIEIIPIDYAKSTLPESWVFLKGDKDVKVPIVFRVFLLKTADRLILVDAGCVTMPGFDMVDFIGPIKALKNMGISVDDITDVILTHHHHDHIECVKEYKNAVVYIQKDEYEKGKQYIGTEQTVKTFDDEIQVCDGVKVIKIAGHSVGSSIVEIAGEDKPTIIAGDECYSRQCLIKKIPTGMSPNPEVSKAFVEKYGSDQYSVLLCHDD
ncbi:MAG: MBL fold metallo-hydrolase [Acutalibacteraceae bacterium]|nr:MBL fold metallo-hydrolase [Acutalibacteraceae bacterium]